MLVDVFGKYFSRGGRAPYQQEISRTGFEPATPTSPTSGRPANSRIWAGLAAGSRMESGVAGIFQKHRADSGDLMPITTVGYQRLIDQHNLHALPLNQVARIDTRVKGREARPDGSGIQLLFEPRYEPEASFEGDLQLPSATRA